MGISNWEEAAAAAKELQTLVGFVVDDVAAKHTEAAVRWAGNVSQVAKDLKEFLAEVPKPKTKTKTEEKDLDLAAVAEIDEQLKK